MLYTGRQTNQDICLDLVGKIEAQSRKYLDYAAETLPKIRGLSLTSEPGSGCYLCGDDCLTHCKCNVGGLF